MDGAGPSEQILQFQHIAHVVKGERSEGIIKWSTRGLAFKNALSGSPHNAVCVCLAHLP